MGHLKYKAYERGKSGNRRLEGHSTLFGINISLNCARDNFLFNGDAHFSLVSVSKFHGPRVKRKRNSRVVEKQTFISLSQLNDSTNFINCCNQWRGINVAHLYLRNG